MLDPTQNFTIVNVSGTYSDVDTSITLVSGDGSKLPDPLAEGAFNLVWWDSGNYTIPSDDPNAEIIRVTAISTDTITISRGQENTTATTKNTTDGEYVMTLNLTSKTLQDIDTYLPYQGTTQGQVLFWDGSKWTYTGDIYTDNTGNVGIGTTGPGAKLDVNGAILGSANSSSELYALALRRSGSSLALPDIWDKNGDGLVLGNDSSSTDLVIDTAGNVGIGTTGPDVKLKLNYAGDDPFLTSSRAGALSIEGGYTTMDMGVNDNSPYEGWIQMRHSDVASYPTSVHDLALQPVGGNVGIGTTGPNTKLHNAGAYTQEPLSADPSDPDAGHSVQWVSDGTGSGDAGDVMMKINVGGNVKIATIIDYSTL
ncbi:hypothetical protein AKJ56_00945 [candidate division MSBL1 archaeon SCGC-AAA382N08]|uniref:Uncharacterized protein n=1 Tax=candidate division MSBL1 archaeon SCGC-AAA382N08 TaxID=1698285 RepID=A0A133VQ15_9EURY|nr:hypothetical protein AKJ56_00945 [candidate division MSBL1 archaeon SCGC-AAA382N08]